MSSCMMPRVLSLVLILAGAVACGSRAAPSLEVAEEAVTDTASLDVQARPRPTAEFPRYPDEMRKKNIEGEVLVRFTVDTTGRVVPGSIRILRSTDYQFTKSVRYFLTRAQFYPAESQGRIVPQTIQQPFNFTLWR